MKKILQYLEYLGGVTDVPPGSLAPELASWLWGLWWGILSLAVYVFCGQSSKFIYIDF